MKQVFTNPILRRLMLINLFFGMSESLIVMRATFLAANGLTPSQVGIIFSITNIIGTFAPLLGGALADKVLTRYKMFLISVAGFGIILFTMPLSATVRFGGLILSMITMPLLQLFHPIGSTMIATCSINAVYTVRGVDYSYLRLWMSLGYTVANFAFSPVISAFGINVPFYASAVFFVLIFFLRGTIRQCETAPDEGLRPKREGRKDSGFKTLFKNYYVLTFTLLTIIYSASFNCYSYISYFLEEHSMPVSSIGIVAGVKVIGEIIIMLLLPKIKHIFSLSGLQILAGAFLCLELTGMQFVKTFPLLLFVVVLGGIGNGISLSSAGLYVRAMAPFGLEATAQSLWMMGISLGGIILSYIFGKIIDVYGILASYRLGLVLELSWVLLFIGSLLFGRYILKKKSVCPLFLSDKEQRRPIGAS